jgi:hypothetical protein
MVEMIEMTRLDPAQDKSKRCIEFQFLKKRPPRITRGGSVQPNRTPGVLD